MVTNLTDPRKLNPKPVEDKFRNSLTPAAEEPAAPGLSATERESGAKNKAID